MENTPEWFSETERSCVRKIRDACRAYPEEERTFSGTAFEIFGSEYAWKFVETFVQVKQHSKYYRCSYDGDIAVYKLSFRFKQ